MAQGELCMGQVCRKGQGASEPSQSPLLSGSRVHRPEASEPCAPGSDGGFVTRAHFLDSLATGD